jgi:isoaspartyl peptidase/L-asparaginase-like protein (Ntn-hydrolase superfamily)
MLLLECHQFSSNKCKVMLEHCASFNTMQGSGHVLYTTGMRRISARIMVRACSSIAAVEHRVEQARYRTHTSIIFERSESKNDICCMASVQGATSCIEE